MNLQRTGFIRRTRPDRRYYGRRGGPVERRNIPTSKTWSEFEEGVIWGLAITAWATAIRNRWPVCPKCSATGMAKKTDLWHVCNTCGIFARIALSSDNS